ncbi:type IV-A pilus assembly ATPase PilB [Kangiella sediminilitoris]|uniref:Type II secretory protein GspE n=1 Tax=Kangiella sediminilitoris TaxID=1144748 RepID=A0A1B3BCA9_9GAMM|nr:type IV-A pilus assembly ATPase PilB [Kangiella sediminilitoris]AOE50451.1 type II secretory protein GspE [Kangiella sediminilitoris]
MALVETGLTGLAHMLVAEGLIEKDKVREAIERAKEEKVGLIDWLVNAGWVEGRSAVKAQGVNFGAPFFDVSALNVEDLPKDIIDLNMMRKHRAIPLFKRGSRLFIGVSDATNLKSLEEIRFQTNCSIEAVLVEPSRLDTLVDKLIEEKENESLSDFDDADLDNIDLDAVDDSEASDVDEGAEKDDAPVVKFVKKMLVDAIRKGASDLHFEPYEKKYRVRFRIDGMLHEVASPPIQLSARISARLKVLSNLDISERRVPQDGRVKLKLSRTKAIDFRVNTLPTLFGEKIVMRILDPSSAMLGVDALGFEPKQKEHFMTAINKPQGMVLVTGPTGSGKTVTLYTGVNILNDEHKNISTAEDPVEINLAGVNQVNVNIKAGLTFASALRAFLRQDPDIVLVGEIRDLETAEIAIKASQTGHLVLSTLHTNSAPETLTRLVNMGVAPFNIATTVNLVVAQRLARRLCEHCKKPSELPEEALLEEGFTKEELNELTVYEPVGCDKCTLGYKGRVGLFQVMPVSEATGRIIMEGGNAIDIADQAKKENIPDLRRAGLNKIKLGATSLEEVNRVTQD